MFSLDSYSRSTRPLTLIVFNDHYLTNLIIYTCSAVYKKDSRLAVGVSEISWIAQLFAIMYVSTEFKSKDLFRIRCKSNSIKLLKDTID